MRFIYDLIFFIFSILYIPCLVLKQKWHKDFKMRFGFIPQNVLADLTRSTKNIWIHAVSVGEVLAVSDLVNNLHTLYPDYQIIFSTVTKTGNELAQTQLKNKAVVIYAPLDFSFVVRKFVRLINPSLYISAETELWPNLFVALGKRKIPIVLVNGRISDKSFSHYLQVKWLVRPVINHIRKFCVQSEIDKERLVQLGAQENRIVVTGNMKFDVALKVGEESLLSSDYQFLLGGSTHPGEEEVLLNIYQEIMGKYSGLRLVLAPRHVERANDICRLVEARQLRAVKFSLYEKQPISEHEVIVVDVIGKLRMLYRDAFIVFIGKTLCANGGQNMIEPALFAKPVLVGPHTQNFRDVMRLFLKNDAMIQVKNEEELKEKTLWLLNNSLDAQTLGEKAAKVVFDSRGAITNTLKNIKDVLNQHESKN